MASILKKIFRSRSNDEYNLGIALYNEGKYLEAITHFENAMGEASKSSTTYRLGVIYTADAHIQIGRSLLKSEQYEEAGKHLQKALVENPNYPDWHYDMGVCLFMAGDRENALPYFERALEINPDYLEASCFLAVTQHSLGKVDKARELLREVASRPSEVPIQVSQFLVVNLKERATILPEIGSVLELLESLDEFREVYTDGINCYNVGSYDLAVGLLRKAANMKPHYADIQCQLGLALFKNNELNDAMGAFRNALAVNPRFLEASYFLGITLLKENRYLEADEALEYALELKPEATDVLFHLAHCKYHLGRSEIAENCLEKVLEQKPEFAQALYLLGLIRFADGKGDEGIELLNRAITLNPHLSGVELDLALMYLNQGEWEGAEEILRRLRELDREDVDLSCFLGRSRLVRGQLDQALTDFEQALQIDPNNLYALKGRLHCEIKLGRLSRAEEIVSPVLAEHPDYPDFRKLHGDIQFRKGNYPGAEADYRQALTMAPEYLEAKLGLVLTLRNQAKSDEAGQILRDLAAQHPENMELRKLLNSNFMDMDEVS